MKLNEKFLTIVTFCGGVLGYFLGGLDHLIDAFAVILVVDTFTGMLKSCMKGTYSSKLFRTGLLKKCGYMLAVMLAVQLDNITGDSGTLRGAMIIFSIANEGASIVENLGEIGVPFPDVIVNSIAVLKKEPKKKD